ncbi:MAG TPA: hypothetical protein VGF95_07710 [Solirubrobacteraceae bacterium]|jgi:hypothetical protein
MSARRLLVAVFCALAGTFWLGAGVAGAAKIVSGSFGSSGAGAGQFSTTAPGAVAVNLTGEGGAGAGDVYVVDRSNFRIDEFSASGGFVRAFGLNVGGTGVDVCTSTCQAGTSSAAAGGLVFPEGIAIDQATGVVYVSDMTNHRVDVFSATGAFEGAFGWNVESAGANTLQFCTVTCQAGTAGAGAGEIGTGTASGYLAFSSAGDLYLGDYTNKRVDEFAPAISAGAVTGVSFVHAFGWGVVNGASELQSCTTMSGCEAGLSGAGAGEFGTSAIQGIAIDSTGAIYVANEPATCAATNPCRVQKFNAAGTSATEFAAAQLTRTSGTSSSEAVNQIAVEASDNDVYLARPNAAATERDILAFTSNGALLATDGLGAGLPAATGLAVGAGGSLYFSESTNRKVYILQKPTHPSIDALFSANVASTSVTLQAQVDPNGADTHYYIQYGGETCSTVPSECVDLQTPPGLDIGAGEADQVVSVHLQALLPDTLYHYRIVASNATETTEAEATFTTTQGVGGPLTLLDGREWELVSPTEKYGAGIIPERYEGGVIQAAEDGSGLVYLAENPIETEPEGNSSPEPTEVFARRLPAGGWSNRTMTTPSDDTHKLPIGTGTEYRLFSPNLSDAILEPIASEPLAPGVSVTQSTIYLRGESACAEGKSSCYTALLSGEDTASGAEYGGAHFAGASKDLKHALITSEAPLLAGAPEGGLYEWSEGALQLVSIDESGVAVRGEAGGAGGENNVRGAISNDGSRVFFCALATRFGGGCEYQGPLYMRDLVTQETVRLDPATSTSREFQIATEDGSRVFFSYLEGSQNRHLDECEVQEVAGKLSCERSEVATEDVGSVLGIDGNGTIVYFVSEAALAGKAVAGEDNLYVARLEGGKWTPTFIATLSPEDERDWATHSTGHAEMDHMTSRVSPNGRYVAFMSDRSLTGYDNHDAVSGEPDQEVFLYDEQSGELSCASCNPTGARPDGIPYESGLEPPLVNKQAIWNGNWTAASVPGWVNIALTQAIYQTKYLTDEGRLFFNSSDDLSPQDSNGLVDVYEYEPEGVGSCTRTEGCVQLISSGTSGEESVFLDASASGNDVFFLSSAQLTPADDDTAYDVYDAHVCGSEVPCEQRPVSPPPCTSGEACKPGQTPQPAIYGAPASATFSGAGNVIFAAPKAATKSRPRAKLVKCKKGVVKKKGKTKKKKDKCVKKSKAKKAKKASNKRGAGR